jgi:hypothetical protein
MADKTFEVSLTAVTVLVIAWMVVASLMGILHPAWAVVTGIVLWLLIGGTLLHFWGKSYMERG